MSTLNRTLILAARQVIAEDSIRTACFKFETAWWNVGGGDMLQHIVELQCAIDDAIDSLATVHA